MHDHRAEHNVIWDETVNNLLPAVWQNLLVAPFSKPPLVHHSQEDEAMPDDVHLLTEVQSLRSRRILRTLALVQDLSDGLMAINDVTGKAALLCIR